MKKCLMIFMICIPLVFSGCIEKNSIKDEEKRNTPIISLENMPESLVSFQTKDEEEIGCALFEGLVTLGDSGEIEGALAKEYKVSSDGITYEFTLRDDIFWSNGKEITAYDFVDFFKNLLDPKEKIEGLENMYCIFGAKDYNQGKGQFSSVAIDSVDKKKLKIRMNYKDDSFLYNLTQPKFRLRKNFNLLKDYKNQYENIDYSGAYKISSIKDDKVLKLKSNDKYWDTVKAQELDISINSNEMATAAFGLGKVDFLFNLPLTEGEDLEDYLDYAYVGDMYSVVFNMRKDKIGESSVFRKAIEESLKVLYIKDDIYKNGGFVDARGNMSFISREQGAKLAMSNNEHDSVNLSKVNQWLKEINFDKNTDLTLLCPKDNMSMFLGEKLKSVLKEELELNVRTSYLDDEDYEKALSNGNFSFALKLFKDSKNPKDFFSYWTKDNEKNYAGYSSLEYEKIFQRYKTSSSDSDKVLLNQILKRDVPYIPICYTSMSYGVSPNISSLKLDGNNNINFKTIEFSTK